VHWCTVGVYRPNADEYARRAVGYGDVDADRDLGAVGYPDGGWSDEYPGGYADGDRHPHGDRHPNEDGYPDADRDTLVDRDAGAGNLRQRRR